MTMRSRQDAERLLKQKILEVDQSYSDPTTVLMHPGAVILNRAIQYLGSMFSVVTLNNAQKYCMDTIRNWRSSVEWWMNSEFDENWNVVKKL